MNETIGTLDLKIARLQQRLTVVEQRLRLSRSYPEYHLLLKDVGEQLQSQLHHLYENRKNLTLSTTPQ